MALKLTNPVASFISIPLENWFDFNLGPKKDGFRYTLEAQPVYPMRISKEWNLISRTTVAHRISAKRGRENNPDGLERLNRKPLSIARSHQVVHSFRQLGYNALLSFEMARICTRVIPSDPEKPQRRHRLARWKMK